MTCWSTCSICCSTMNSSITRAPPASHHPAPGHTRPSTRGCSAAASSSPASGPAAHRGCESPARRSASRWARTCRYGASATSWPGTASARSAGSAASRLSAFSPRARSVRGLAQQLLDLGHQPVEALGLGGGGQPRPRDQHVVGGGRKQPLAAGDRLAQAPLDLVSVDGAADLARYRVPDPRGVAALGGAVAQRQVAAADRSTQLRDGVELGGTREAPALRYGGRGGRVVAGHGAVTLCGEALAATEPATFDHGAAGARAHALAKAVGLGALAGVGLIGALHAGGSIEQRCPRPPRPRYGGITKEFCCG